MRGRTRDAAPPRQEVHIGFIGMLPLILSAAVSLVLPSGLQSISLPRATAPSEAVSLGDALAAKGTTCVIFGTYPADFNMIEYAQRVTHYLPALKASGVDRVLCIVNGKPTSCNLLAELVGLPSEVELLSDEAGDAGRAFGVARGWLPDTDEIEITEELKLPVSPYAKLFGMLLGLGAGNTLPSVITGYLGNPSGKNGWIVQALAQGQKAGRWPNIALDLDASGAVTRNAFDELPVVGGWGRRPLELATLRLQTMLGVSLAKWEELQPTDERCLTQLGGLLVCKDGEPVFEYKDNGICAVCDFETLVTALEGANKASSPVA